MSENKVSVEITLEERAALRALNQLTKEIQKTEYSFKELGSSSTSQLSKASKSIKDAEEAFRKGLGSVGNNTKATSQDLKNYEERTKQAALASEGFFGKIKNGSSSAFGQLVGGVTIANLASNAIVGTANSIKEFVTGSINAAIEQENAINRLNQALRASGDFSQRASQDFIDFSSGLQKVSIFGDEVVIGQLAVAKSFGASNDQAKELVQAAANLSATFGGSLDSNVEKLGKTFSGQAGRLAQYIPELKKLTTAQLESGAAFDVVNRKFAGAAANELNSYGGKLTAAKNAYSDLQEEMGRFVIENGYVTKALEFAKTSFNGLIGAQRMANELFGIAGTPLQEQRKKMAELAQEYNTLTDSIKSLQGMKQATEKFGAGEEGDLIRIKELTSAITEAEARKNQIMIERKGLRQADIADQKLASEANQKTNAPGGFISDADQKMIDSRMAAKIQLQQIESDHQLFLYNQHLSSTEVNAVNQGEELENLLFFEQQKIDAVYAAEIQKNSVINDEETRRLADKAALNKKILAMDMSLAASEKTINAKKIADNQKASNDQVAMIGQTAALGQAILKDGSKEAFLLGKAAALAQVAVSTATGMANALLIPDPTPTQSIRAAAIIQAKVTGALSAATIVASAIKGYQDGGIIPGQSYSGDRVMARVNSGEMILNRQQQTQLFNLSNGSNGSGSGSGNGGLVEEIRALRSDLSQQVINLSVDGRVLATAIRKEVLSGFRLI